MSSWFQTTNIATLAKNAFKEAQKTIDKALDIGQEPADGTGTLGGAQSSADQFTQLTTTVSDAASDFFNSWGAVTTSSKGGKSGTDTEVKSTSVGNVEVLEDNKPTITSPPVSSAKMSASSGKKRRMRSRPGNLQHSEPNIPSLSKSNVKHKLSDSSDVISIDLDDPALPGPVGRPHEEGGNEKIKSTESVEEGGGDFGESSQHDLDFSWFQKFQSDPNANFCEPSIELSGQGVESSKCKIEDFSEFEMLKSESITADLIACEIREVASGLLEELEVKPESKDQDQTKYLDNKGTTDNKDAEDNKDEDTDKNIPLETLYTSPVTVPSHESLEDLSISKGSLSEADQSHSSSISLLLNSDSSEANTVLAADLESSSGTLMQESCDNSDDNVEEHRPKITKEGDEQGAGNGECGENHDQGPSSKICSPSSLTMSSISVISEEKHEEFESQPHSSTNSNTSSPSSPNEHPDYSAVMSIKQSSQHNLQASSPSTPERGHSRSNSNSSSSIDHQQQSHAPHNQSVNISPVQHQQHHYNQGLGAAGRKSQSSINFPLSSASSSDIEVIPLDSLESSTTMLYHPSIVRRVSVQEVETQTEGLPQSTVQPQAISKTSAILEEKDLEIAQLREEGEKLSKKQFDLSTIIKKLRAKEKENENTVKTLKNDIDTKAIEIERLMKTFLQKESIEQRQVQAISKLTNEKATLEETVNQLKSKLEDSEENCASMKASLEDASIEILELQNTISSAQHDTTQIDILTREKSDLLQQNQAHQKEIEQLRLSMTSIQSKSSAREQELKAQIQKHVQKVQSLETQLGDMTDEIADVTMPLSIQIEKLQSELKTNDLQFQRREKQLNDQIAELELKLRHSLEREKSTQDNQGDYKAIIIQLENQVEQLESDRKLLKLEVDTLKQDKVNLSKKCHSTETEFQHQQQQLNNCNEILDKLEADLKSQTMLYETEKRKCTQLTEQLKSVQQQRSFGGDTSGNTSPVQTVRSNHSTVSESSYLEEVFDSNNAANNNVLNQNHMAGGMSTPKSSTSVFDSLPVYNNHFPSSAPPYYLENLYAQLRRLENELIQLQSDAIKNERIRKTLNDEIAKLTVENQQLDARLEQLSHVQEKLGEVEKNYNAVLQLYGEKVEEVEELRLDLADIKEMYKNQIEQLVRK